MLKVYTFYKVAYPNSVSYSYSIFVLNLGYFIHVRVQDVNGEPISWHIRCFVACYNFAEEACRLGYYLHSITAPIKELLGVLKLIWVLYL